MLGLRRNTSLAPRGVIAQLALALLLVLGGVAPVHAADAALAGCVVAHEEAQIARSEEKLTAAQRSLLVCSAKACPAAVQTDCVSWYAEIASEVPSLIVTARRGEDDLMDAVLFIDGQAIATDLMGKEHELDPGRHTIRLEVAGEAPQEKTVLLSQGEKARAIRFDFAPSTPPSGATTDVPRPVAKDTPQETFRPIPGVTYGLAGVAVVGATVGTVFAVSALNQRKELNDSCAPYCTDDDKASVDKRLVTADIVFGIGLAAGVGAVVTYLLRPRVPLSLALHTGPREASIRWRSQW